MSQENKYRDSDKNLYPLSISGSIRIISEGIEPYSGSFDNSKTFIDTILTKPGDALITSLIDLRNQSNKQRSVLNSTNNRKYMIFKIFNYNSRYGGFYDENIYDDTLYRCSSYIYESSNNMIQLFVFSVYSLTNYSNFVYNGQQWMIIYLGDN